MITESKLSLADANRYLKLQAECGFCVDDIVKVVRKAETYENGWKNSWTPEMDSTVGQIRTISDIKEYGIRFKEVDCYSFPFFVLEPVKSIKECNVDD